MAEEMIPITVGLWPADFGSGLPGCKRWHYRVIQSYKTNLECSRACPPVHEASFLYNGTRNDDFPDHLHAQVKTEFSLTKRRRYTLTELRKSIRHAPVRHISLRLEARIKRSGHGDYYEIPSPDKEGAILEVNTEFGGVEIGTGLLRTVEVCEARPCRSIQANLRHEVNRSIGVNR